MQVFKALVPPTDVSRRWLRAGQNRQADPNRRDLVPMELVGIAEGGQQTLEVIVLHRPERQRILPGEAHAAPGAFPRFRGAATLHCHDNVVVEATQRLPSREALGLWFT